MVRHSPYLNVTCHYGSRNNLKSRAIYIIGTTCGALTLIVGISIFLIWWAVRRWFAIGLIDLEIYGFFWIMIATPIAIIGLLLILFSIGNNFPKFLLRTIGSLLLILANIPALYLILEKQADIQQRAYIKLINESNSEIKELRIFSTTFKKEFEDLENNESLVTNFYPKYLSDSRESVPEVDPVTVSIQTSKREHLTTLPILLKGSCSRIIITDQLELKWQLND